MTFLSCSLAACLSVFFFFFRSVNYWFREARLGIYKYFFERIGYRIVLNYS